MLGLFLSVLGILVARSGAVAQTIPDRSSCEYAGLYQYSDSADDRVLRAYISMGDMDSYEVLRLTAKCYMDRREYAGAIRVLEHLSDRYDHYVSGSDVVPPEQTDRAQLHFQEAIAYNALGQHEKAVNAVEMAHIESPDDDDITAAYKRIAKAAFRMDQANMLDAERSFWDSSSPDERRVLTLHGGSRDNNKTARPCHIESFQSGELQERTWWYCGSAGTYVIAYHFRNGHLASKYHP